MNEGELLYFSPAEFELMLELSPGAKYYMYRAEKDPEDRDIIQAIHNLLQRNMLQWQGDELIPGSSGAFFKELRNAPQVVMLNAVRPKETMAMCYIADPLIWMAEQVGEKYRLRCFDRRSFLEWLFNSDLLTMPMLDDEDVKEISMLFEDVLKEPSGQSMLVLEKYRNGGGFLGRYEVLKAAGKRLVQINDGKECITEFYTRQSLLKLMTECFGEDDYDYCECQSSGPGEGI